ncbi:MAG: holo-ACP synthase [Actinomycetota bacterium]
MIGVDVVGVERLRRMLADSPRLTERLFTNAERAYCERAVDPVIHFAGTLAAKEAVIKALDLGPLNAWARRIEIERDANGAPTAHVRSDDVKTAVEVSISHDAGVAIAVALRTS